MPSPSPERLCSGARRWSGPAVAVLGLIALAATAALAQESPLARWVLTETLSPARVLPLLGLGVAFALIGGRALIAALLLFGLGIVAGLYAEDQLLRLIDHVPGAATQLFLVGPMSYLAAGSALLPSTRWRDVIAPVAALLFGAVLGLTVRLTDPSLHEALFIATPVVVALWIVVAVMLTLRAFRRGWFAIAGRILGSWMLAIGLLTGGAALLPLRKAPPPLPPLPAQRAPATDRNVPGMPEPLPRPGEGLGQP